MPRNFVAKFERDGDYPRCNCKPCRTCGGCDVHGHHGGLHMAAQGLATRRVASADKAAARPARKANAKLVKDANRTWLQRKLGG